MAQKWPPVQANRNVAGVSVAAVAAVDINIHLGQIRIGQREREEQKLINLWRAVPGQLK